MKNKDLPKDLLYNKDSSWVKIDGDIATMGMTKPSADKVKEFAFIQLPEKNKKIKKGETYCSLEAIKWSGHLSSPLSGEIIEVNKPLFDDPSIINKDPYEKGWIVKLKISNKNELENLIRASEVKE
jgi:glycine cleavage system H protein